MRQAIAALDPALAPQQSGTIREVTKIVTGTATMMTNVLISFACLGLFLAAIGLYGVIARVVAQRTAEIGVRVALGAQSRDIVWLIVRSGLSMTLLGTAVGVAGATALGWVLSQKVPGAAGNEPIVYVGIAAILVGVGLLACFLPARRATQVDPMTALRAE
jgi:putative ABC transport system permease protein